MQNRIEEIVSYLKHADYSLAVRRTLDLCLDTNDKVILQKAIEMSKHYNELNLGNKLNDNSAEIAAEANSILEQLRSFKNFKQNDSGALITADGVSKTYSAGSFSLKPTSVKITSGNITGVVGENGNGKTTLLRCLAGQLALDNGSINYTNLSNPDFYTIKHHVAFIPQRIPKWYGLLKDNLHFSASLSGVFGADNELMVEFMLERLGLSKYANLTWNEISSGYRTRFEIARVLLQKPTLLILDEPLANLDINAQQTILTDLRYMAKSVYHPMGVILSSQQLHEVEKVADTVLFIKNGECVYKTGDDTAAKDVFVVEIETGASREQILKVLGDTNIQLQFNGGFYTISSSNLNAQQVVANLINSNISINYFRDITHSTKRFF